ncbi:glycosyltransferase [Desulfocucumis palustris]|uniref:glycosyltransferase n=1 Tax=Desulfocucumis palustris TaxID=1898651 RepID=UPI000CEA705B|nr:glycosyltransferase [Desulfocucumis palustris]
MPVIIHPPSLRFRWMFQRPQQLFNQFAQLGFQAIFCNPAGKKEPASVKKLSENLFICTKSDPLSIPHSGPRILWISAPSFVRHINRYRPHMVVYDALDDPSEEFSSWAPYVEEVRKRADIIFATSMKILNENRKFHPEVHLCPNGVDFEHFVPAQTGTLVRPADIPDNGRPTVGYIGALATWLDWELIDHITEKNPEYNFIFVGPLYNTRLPFHKNNMFVTGYKEYRYLPNYLQCFDVCLIPFKVTSMTRGCNPIKMYEYLSSGKPVVSTPLPEVAGMGEILIGTDPEGFNNFIHQAIHGDKPENRLKRIEIARQNSWERRARSAIEIMENKLRARGFLFSD